MTILTALLFGLIQGLTEFIPVSSSAHLSVLSNLFGVISSGFNIKAFSIFVHFGTVIAALIFYWQDYALIIFQAADFAALSRGQSSRQSRHYTSVRLLLMMCVAILPLFLILPFNNFISSLNYNSAFVGVMLVLSGVILYIADQFKEGDKTEKNMSLSDALIIGLCQAVAIIPGISRIGTVFTAGLAIGLKKDFSARFAVLLSVPVMIGANLFRIFDAAKDMFTWRDLPACLLGMAAAIVSGIFALRVFKTIADNGKFKTIAWYCWVAGVLSVILTMIF